MERVEACRICLITDVKMENIQGSVETNIKSVFGHNVLFSSDLPEYCCYECSALIAEFSKFRKKYFTAQSLLFNILQNDGMVTERAIKNIDRVASKLNSNISTTLTKSDQGPKIKIKCEAIEDELEITVKEETYDSDSEHDVPLHSVKQIEHVNVNTTNKMQHPSKRKDNEKTEINSGESPNKTRKLQEYKDFDVAKLAMEFRPRASSEQFSIMLHFMERNGDLSKPLPGIQGRLRADHQWNELTELLNSVGGSGIQKPSDKWKKVWSDWKTKTKKKAYLMNKDTHGAGSSRARGLNPLEERVLRVIGLKPIMGHQDVQEAAFEVQPYSETVGTLSPSQPTRASSPPAFQEARMSPQVRLQHTPEPRLSNTGTFNVASNPTRHEEVIGSPSAAPSKSCRRCVTVQRRRHYQTSYEKAISEFVRIEHSRLRLDKIRILREHKRDMERIRVESQRIALEDRRTDILERIADAARNVMELLQSRLTR